MSKEKKSGNTKVSKDDKYRSFHITKEQYQKYIHWRKSLPEKNPGIVGGGYHFVFTPTTLGEVVKVKRDDGHEVDLTDYDNF